MQPVLIKKNTTLLQAVNPELEFHTARDEEEASALLAHTMAIQSILKETQEWENPASTTPESFREPKEGEDKTPGGPKTAEVPDNKIYPSEKLRELLDWEPDGPEWARDKFFEIAEKHVKAFGFDG